MPEATSHPPHLLATPHVLVPTPRTRTQIRRAQVAAVLAASSALLIAGCNKKEASPSAEGNGAATATTAPGGATSDAASGSAASTAAPAAAPAPVAVESLPPPQASQGPFQINVDKPSYSNGDKQKVTLRTPDKGWIYIGSVNYDGKVYLYYPNPTMPSSKVMKDLAITLPPAGQLSRDAWEINIGLPEGVAKGREIVFAVLAKEPLPGVTIEWGLDQRDALTKAGVLKAGAKIGMPPAECFPSGEGYQTAWREYEVGG